VTEIDRLRRGYQEIIDRLADEPMQDDDLAAHCRKMLAEPGPQAAAGPGCVYCGTVLPGQPFEDGEDRFCSKACCKAYWR